MKTVMVVEISNATDEQIQKELGKAFTKFCQDHKGTGITASVLTDAAAKKAIEFINQEDAE